VFAFQTFLIVHSKVFYLNFQFLISRRFLEDHPKELFVAQFFYSKGQVQRVLFQTELDPELQICLGWKAIQPTPKRHAQPEVAKAFAHQMKLHLAQPQPTLVSPFQPRPHYQQ